MDKPVLFPADVYLFADENAGHCFAACTALNVNAHSHGLKDLLVRQPDPICLSLMAGCLI